MTYINFWYEIRRWYFWNYVWVGTAGNSDLLCVNYHIMAGLKFLLFWNSSFQIHILARHDWKYIYKVLRSRCWGINLPQARCLVKVIMNKVECQQLENNVGGLAIGHSGRLVTSDASSSCIQALIYEKILRKSSNSTWLKPCAFKKINCNLPYASAI